MYDHDIRHDIQHIFKNRYVCVHVSANVVWKKEKADLHYITAENNFAITVATKWKPGLIAKCLTQGVSQRTKVKSILDELGK